jgi:hypothetical protein
MDLLTVRTSHAVRVVDLLVVAWIVTWIVLGVVISREVRDLRRLGDTMVKAGAAVEETGRAIGTLGGLPFVGPRIRQVQGRIEAAARSAVASGRESRRSAERLGVLLGVSIALIPTLPLLALYVPARLSWVMDVRSVRRSVRRAGDDPVFLEFLARRAAENLPYDRLRDVSPNPWRDIEDGRYEPLARAELRRLGLRDSLSERRKVTS